MKCFQSLNTKFAVPTILEWRKINCGIISIVNDYQIVNITYFDKVFDYALKRNALNTFKALGVLELRELPYRVPQWYPTILYWPEGYSIVNEEDFNVIGKYFIRVNFRTFHCFDCGLDIDGYSLDRDSYILKNEELIEMYETFDFFALKCPNCKGNMRNPALVEYLKT